MMNGGAWVGPSGEFLEAKRDFGLMGIVNLTPDSFYDGGKYFTPDNALAHAESLLKSGADILDIGAESTRPGAIPVQAAEERERLAPMLAALRQSMPETVISVDTMRASTAAFALCSGARIINDVMGRDPAMPEVLAHYKAAYIVMHNGNAEEGASYAGDIVFRVKVYFDKRMRQLVGAGLPENRIMLDPGIGFGKTMEENLVLLGRFNEFLDFGRPLLSAISMKSLFGYALGLPLSERGESTAIASALLWLKGVFWHRAHKVAQVRDALALASRLAV